MIKKLREFKEGDWDAFAGVESDESRDICRLPLIGEHGDDCAIIVDKTGVQVMLLGAKYFESGDMSDWWLPCSYDAGYAIATVILNKEGEIQGDFLQECGFKKIL